MDEKKLEKYKKRMITEYTQMVLCLCNKKLIQRESARRNYNKKKKREWRKKEERVMQKVGEGVILSE